MPPDNLDTVLRSIALRTWDLFSRQPMVYVIASALVLVVGTITAGLLFGPLIAGFIELTRRHSRGESIAVTELFDGLTRMVPCVVTFLIIGVTVAAGMMLLVIPGLVIALLWMFAFHAIVYTNAHSGSALIASYHIVKDNFLVALVVVVAVAALGVLGGSIVVGSVLTVPLSFIALTVTYEELTAATIDRPKSAAPSKIVPSPQGVTPEAGLPRSLFKAD